MTEIEKLELINTATPYLGLIMQVPAGKPSLKKTKPYTFYEIDDSGIGFGEPGENIKYPIPKAKLRNEEGEVITLPLTQVVLYFENL